MKQKQNCIVLLASFLTLGALGNPHTTAMSTFASSHANCLDNGSWSQPSYSGSIEQRHEAGFVRVDERFYLFGGRGDKDMEIFNPNTNTWTKGESPPYEIHHFQAVAVGDEIWVAGAMIGNYPGEDPLDRILIYDTNSDSWRDGPSIPSNRLRGSCGVVVRGDCLYLVSGIQDGHRSGWVTWLDEYNMSTGVWTILPDAPTARDHFQSVLADNKIWNAAGRQSGRDGTFNYTIDSVDYYDFDTGAWNTLPSADNIPTERAGNMAINYGGMVVVLGGESGNQDSAHNEVEALNPITKSWISFDDLVTGRHGTGVVQHNGNLYMVSGSAGRGGGPEQTSMEQYSLPNNQDCDGDGINDADEIEMYNSLGGNDDTTVTPPSNSAPSVSAGSNVSLDLSGSSVSVTLSGNVSDDGLPSNSLSLTWTQVSGPTSSFTSATNGSSVQLSFTQAGSYVYRLTATDGDLSSSDTTTVTVSAGNQPPVMSFSSPNSNVLVVSPGYDLGVVVEASDPDGSVSNILLYRDSTFIRRESYYPYEWGSANSKTELNGLGVGSYSIRAIGTDNDGATTEISFTLVVEDDTPVSNGTPSANAGSDTVVTLNSGSASVSLSGNVSDDGLPSNSLSSTWTKVAGPGNVTFSDAFSSSTVASFDAAGVYTLRLTASDSSLIDTDTIQVTVNDQVDPVDDGILIPGTVEAEEYVDAYDKTGGNSGETYRFDDVDIQNTGDASGLYNVGWTSDDEWLEYDVSVQSSGVYEITARLAARSSTGRLRVLLDGVSLGEFAAQNTGNWQSYTDVTVTGVPLTAGSNRTLRLEIISGGFNINYLNFTQTGDTVDPTDPFDPSLQNNIPGRLEVEEYDEGDNGDAYYDTSGGNSGEDYRNDDVDIDADRDGTGSYILGWTAQGEWLEYTANVQAGTYDLVVRASSRSGGGRIKILVDGQEITTVAIPNTGSWDNYQDINVYNVTIPSNGVKVVRLEIESSGFDINYIDFN